MKFKLAMIVAVLAVFVSFCLNAAEPQKIVVWAMGYEGTVIGKMARLFESENPGIKIETQAVPWDAAHEKLLTSVVGDVPPDISQVGTTWLAEFQSMGAFEQLDGYLERSEIKKEDFFRSSFGIGRINNKIYGIPWYVDTRVLYYRKDFLKSVGYQNPPKNWREFLDVSAKLSRDTDSDGKTDRFGIALAIRDWQMFLPFLWQNGGSILSDDHKTINVKSDEFAGAVEYYGKFFEKNAAPVENPGYDLIWAFKEGIYPMFISGPWMVDMIKKQIPEIEGQWGVTLLPGNKNRNSFVGGSHLAVFRKSKNKAAAWKFVEFMSRPDIQIKWFEIAGSLPSNRKAWESGYFKDKPFMNVFGQQMLYTESPPNVPEWEEMAEMINQSIEEILLKKKSIVESQELLYANLENIMSKKKEGSKNIFVWLFVTVVLGAAVVYSYSRKISIKRRAYLSGTQEESEPEREIPGGIPGRGFKTYYIPLLFVIPSIFTLFVFLFFPIFSSFFISLTDWNIYSFSDLGSLKFIGLKNYLVLFHDKVFWQAILNTVIFSGLSIPANIIISVFLAIMIDKKYIKHKAFFRGGYFMPVVTTLVAVAVIWRWLYNPEYGLINYLFGLVGISRQTWLSSPYLALPSLIIMSVWKGFGYNMVIVLAGLQTIPSSLYEAASVDGADGWQTFWNITIPSLKPTLFFVTIMTTISSFQFFAEPYIMTKGGPLNKTISMVMYMYNQGFKYFKFGYASAIAYVLFIFILLFTLVQLYYKKKLEDN